MIYHFCDLGLPSVSCTIKCPSSSAQISSCHWRLFFHSTSPDPTLACCTGFPSYTAPNPRQHHSKHASTRRPSGPAHRRHGDLRPHAFIRPELDMSDAGAAAAGPSALDQHATLTSIARRLATRAPPASRRKCPSVDPVQTALMILNSSQLPARRRLRLSPGARRSDSSHLPPRPRAAGGRPDLSSSRRTANSSWFRARRRICPTQSSQLLATSDNGCAGFALRSVVPPFIPGLVDHRAPPLNLCLHSTFHVPWMVCQVYPLPQPPLPRCGHLLTLQPPTQGCRSSVGTLTMPGRVTAGPFSPPDSDPHRFP